MRAKIVFDLNDLTSLPKLKEIKKLERKRLEDQAETQSRTCI